MSPSNPRNELGQQPRGDVRAAVEAVLYAATDTDDEHLTEIVAAHLSRLREDFGETDDLLVQVHRALDLLQDGLYERETRRRTETDESRLRAVQLRLIREELVGLAGRLDGAGAVPEQRSPRWQRESPYQGLWPFEADQAPVFYGRSRLTAELTGHLEACLDRTGMAVVTGASGAGKSSLVRAGLIPAIAGGQLPIEGSSDWPVLTLTPGPNPLDELAAHLAAATGTDAEAIRTTLASRPDQARHYARQAVIAHAESVEPERRDLVRGSGRLLVFVDQFEEAFTLARDDAARSAFIDALFAIGAKGTDAPAGAVVIGVRGDFIDRCAAIPAMVPVLRRHSFVVGPPEPEELRQVITGPAAEAGLRVEEGLADEILADLRAATSAASPGALPLLSQTMFSIWQRRDASGLTRAAYQEIGGVARAIEVAAEEVHLRLTPRQRTLTNELFRRLTVIDRHGEVSRRRAGRSDLLAVFPDLAPVLEMFTAARLLVMTGDTVEIAHDVLLRSWKRLDTWLQSDRMHRALLTEVADDAAEWLDHRRDPSFLYRGAKFETAQSTRAAWDSNPDSYREWNEDVESFLNSARHAATRRSLARRTAAISVTALLAVSVTAAGIAFNTGSELRDERNRLLADNLAATSGEMAGRDGDLSRLLAAAAWDLEPSADHQNAMVGAVGDPVAETVEAHLDDVQQLAYSPTGEYLASSGGEGDIVVWNLERGEEQSRIEGLEGTGALAFSPTGDALAFGADDGVHVVSPANATEQAVLAAPADLSEFQFSPDGNFLLARDGDQTAAWSTEDYEPAKAETEPTWNDDEHRAVAAGGRFAVEWSADAVTLIDLALGQPVRTSYTRDLIIDAAVNPDGSAIAIAVGSEIRNIATADMTAVDAFDTGVVDALDFDANGSMLAVTGAEGTTVWALEDGQLASEPLYNATSRPGDLVRLHPNGEEVLIADEGRYRLIDLETGTEVDVPWNSEDWIAHIDFSPDGRWITVIDGENNSEGDEVSLTLDQHATILDAETGQEHLTIEPVNGETAMLGEDTVAYSPDGQQIAAIAGGAVKVWNLESGTVTAEIPGDFATASGLRFSADSDRLVASGEDAPLVWDQSENQMLTMEQPPGEDAFSVEFDPVASLTADGGYVIQTGSSDRTVRIWDADTGAYITALAMTGEPLLQRHLPGQGAVLGLDAEGSVHRQEYDFLADPYGAVCAEAGRTLTRDEWDEYLPGIGYGSIGVCNG
ncbi:AAA family ATPase [Glycomyces buryatensis]|uniref:Novel STAND NTPase 1 domain-containing protein n=1 Tax=Glycomyces buryatensis TaxID=2570927 RepID=A0A4S8QEB8_9ACTN|nr:AAA family ATPase [Glycomyces buryatensis]THV42680.1 hypothetical protein FAB82_05815 [Glycomyces buryatensis]